MSLVSPCPSLGGEVSGKIVDAIKAKLAELGAYVDDELPDYIMVMIANQKPAEVMKKDLNLFLNQHTDGFVQWLDTVLRKLKKVAMAEKVKKKDKKKTKGSKDSPKEGKGKKKKKTDKKAKTKTGDGEKRKRKKKTPVKKEQDFSDVETTEVKQVQRGREHVERRDSRRSPERRRRWSPTREKDNRRAPARRDYSRSPSYDRQRSKGRSEVCKPRYRETSPPGSRGGLSSRVGAVISHDSDGEYDAETLLKKAVRASEVKVTSRPVRPVTANKNLVMKAVEEADKSIQKKRRDDKSKDEELEAIHRKRMRMTKSLKEEATLDQTLEKIKPPPRQSKKSEKSNQEIIVQLNKSDLRYRLGNRIRQHSSESSEVSTNNRSGLLIQIDNDQQQQQQKKNQQDDEDDEMLEEMRRRALESMKRNRENKMSQPIEVKKVLIPLDEASSSSSEEEDSSSSSDEEDSSSDVSLSDEEESHRKDKEEKDPTFIVTLKGINKNYFKQKRSESLEEAETPSVTTSSTHKTPSIPAPKAIPAEVKKQVPPTPPPKSVQIGKNFNNVKPYTDQPKPVMPKPQAKVAPLKPHITISNSGDLKKPKPSPITFKAKVTPITFKADLKKSDESTKPKRARITAPAPEPPSRLLSSFTPNISTSKERCRFWPKCVRGDKCLYYHPPVSSKRPSDLANKFGWTSASVLP